ncbi:MAG: putative metal-binding motif-containing protein [Thermodesulfobacteriota bacterium]
MKNRRASVRLFLFIALAGCLGLLSAGRASAANCVDNDKDGYVECTGCTRLEGQSCGECNDASAQIRPGAAEFCGDNIDNNCDGVVDFGAGEACTIGYPDNCTEPSSEAPCCFTKSVYVCTADGSGVVCGMPANGVAGLEKPVDELAYTGQCHDGIDNDCDSLTDGADSDCEAALGELCNGLDDDYDGKVDEDFSIGTACEVGTGSCLRTGVWVCADQYSRTCSAAPGNPVAENKPGDTVCTDGLDNDCDGLFDLQDPGCKTSELCDGKDNDGDGLVDENFADLGKACTSGLGQCMAEGVVICAPGGQTTMCGATAGIAGTEGPTGSTCSDSIDNDCDGSVDMEDSSCGSAGLLVSCSLPYYQGKKNPGFDSCVGLHRIRYFTNADLKKNPDALKAELLAMDQNGKILASLPVKNGDLARLASRKRKEDWIVQSIGSNHKVFAPRPVLHVTYDDGNKKAEAFCSDIPFLELLEPEGKVVTQSEGDVTRLFAAIPLVNPSKMQVLVDGVNLFAGLGISNPAKCTFAAPCAGSLLINGRTVTVTDLVVQSTLVGLPGANVLDARIGNLGCGEHVFQLKGIRRPLSFPNTPDEQCLVDDIADRGTSSGLEVGIDSPEDMVVLDEAPVRVTGHACSGREIAGVEINGKVLDVSAQLYTPGDGVNTGGRYDYAIDSTHFITDLNADLNSGNEPLGTFDPGSNRLTAMVGDDLGNRSYDRKVFAIGDIAAPALDASIQTELHAKVQQAVKSATQELDNAFVVGMSKQAIQDLFNERCVSAGQQFIANLQADLVNSEVGSKKIEVSVCSCDPTVHIYVTGFEADANQISCPVDFQNDKMHVTIHLPTVKINLKAQGGCRVEDPIFGACIAKTNVSGTTNTVLSGAKLEFDITEKQLLGTEAPAAPLFTKPINSVPPTGNIHASIGCLAVLCDIIVTPVAALVNLIAGDNLIPVIGFGRTIDINFEGDVGSSAPDPIALEKIKVDEQEVEGTGQKLSAVLSDVQITPQGLVAGLKGNFETLVVDPEIEPTPGAVRTPAPIPSMPVSNADEVFVALADDTFNQFFASMATSGRLKTGCNDTGKTLGDLLPADCSALSIGVCSDDNTVSCKTNADCTGTCQQSPVKTAIARGACYGFKGANCNSLPLAQRVVCNATEAKLADININAGQSLLFCAREDIPPRLLIQDDISTAEVETAVRLNDLSVALVVDRDGSGQLEGELSSTHNCLAQDAPTVGDCSFFGACLDLNIETGMQIATKQCAADPSIICNADSDCATVGGACVQVCAGGDPGFLTRVISVQPTIRSLGVVCGGATATGDDDLLANTSGQDTTIDLMLQNANRFAPPACIKGLDLGGFVQFKDPRLISIDTDGDATFDDYLGLTGKVE